MAKKPVKSKAKSTKSGAKAKGGTKKTAAKAKPAAKAKAKARPAAKAAAKAKPVAKAKPAAKAKKAVAKAKPATKAPASNASSSKTNGVSGAPSSEKAAGNAGATTTTGSSWKIALRDELAKLPDNFAAYCAERGAQAEGAWDVADTDELRGLEAWGKELGQRDRRLGIAALLGIAQAGFARAMATAGSAADNMGFHADEPHGDGAPVGAQIARAAAWLADPSEANREQVVAGFDPTRQLQVWDEDLIGGTEDQPWFWYTEVGQCLACAIMRDDGDEDGNAYEEWPPHTSISRGMVMAVRGLREGGDDAPALAFVRDGMVS